MVIDMPKHVTILPWIIKLADEKVGTRERYRLMAHQSEVKKSKDHFIILDAPTSSGKTLASLLRVTETDMDTIFLYPTNELMRDQAKSIVKWLKILGKTAALVPLDPNTLQVHPKFRDELEREVDYTVIVANGEVLEGMSRTEGRSKGSLLRLLLETAKGRRILLTNIDLLHLLLKFKYFGSPTLLTELLKFRILVVDEFHMYQGAMLANLLFLLWVFRRRFDQVVLCSATLSNAVQLIEKTFRSRAIHAETAEEGYCARRVVHLEIRHKLRIMHKLNDVEEIKQIVNQLYDKYKESPAPVKVLIIVNSVAFCELLGKALTETYNYETVSIIHSFVPNDRRNVNKPIVVGTSAVEIGVDFDVASLIFEATSASSFIQRLGRGGRHRDCEAVCFIPTSSYRQFERSIPNSNTVSNRRLQDAVNKCLETLPVYTDFINSKQCALLYVGFIYGISKGLREKGKVKNVIRDTREKCFEAVFKPPFIDDKHIRNSINLFPTKILNPIVQAGARGDLTSIPAFFEEYQTFSRLEVLDLPRMNFNLLSANQAFQLPVRPPAWAEGQSIVYIRSLSTKPGYLCGKWKEDSFSEVCQISPCNFGVQVPDETVRKLLGKVLHGRLAYSTSDVSDWRFPVIYEASGSRKLVIGLDALIQEYLNQKYSNNRRRHE